MDALVLAEAAPAPTWRSFAALALLAFPAGALGAFAVLRRLAFTTHALAVGTFPGVVLAASAGVSTFLGGLGAAAVLAALLALLVRERSLDQPAATGIVLAGALAAGSLLASDVSAAEEREHALLLGSLESLSGGELARTGAVAAVAAAAFALLHRRWLELAFDREAARAAGSSPGRLDAALFLCLGVVVVGAVDIVGSLLVSSLFVVPAATARLLVARFVSLVALASALTLAEAAAGLEIAAAADVPPGTAIAVLAGAVFAAAYAGAALARRLLARAVG